MPINIKEAMRLITYNKKKIKLFSKALPRLNLAINHQAKKSTNYTKEKTEQNSDNA